MKKSFVNLKTILIFVLILFGVMLILLRGMLNKSQSYFMMDTYVTIQAKGINSGSAIKAAHKRLLEIEQKMNDHNKNSNISMKNYDDDLLYVLKKGLYYGKVSDGLFDITIKPLTQLWNITSDNPTVPKDEEIKKALSQVNYKNVRIDKDTVSVPKDCSIDLGGIAKGYAADEIIKIFKDKKIKDAIINLGGNVYALGKKRVGIQNPLLQNGNYMGVLTVSDCSVVTSGAYERYFKENGKIYHHILNPFTGYPCETDLVSVTVIAKNSIDADACATLLFMLGKDKAIRKAEELGIKYILIDKNNKVYISKDVDFSLSDNEYEVVTDV